MTVELDYFFDKKKKPQPSGARAMRFTPRFGLNLHPQSVSVRLIHSVYMLGASLFLRQRIPQLTWRHFQHHERANPFIVHPLMFFVQISSPSQNLQPDG
jgi:hypothetical protein